MMTAVRKRLGWIAAGWLVCRLVASLVAPVALFAQIDPSLAHVVECDCPDAVPGRACPMHAAPRPGRSGDDASRECGMRNARPSVDIVLLALAGDFGIPVLSAAFLHDFSSATIDVSAAGAPSRATLPDAPPPRA